jgi:hypothetical protein
MTRPFEAGGKGGCYYCGRLTFAQCNLGANCLLNVCPPCQNQHAEKHGQRESFARAFSPS